jgi:hypothetical protein
VSSRRAFSIARAACAAKAVALTQLVVVEIRLVLVDADDSDDAVADDHRRADPAADACGAAEVTREMGVVRDVGEDLRPLRPHDLAVEVGLVVQVEALADQRVQIVEAAPSHDYQAAPLDHLHRATVVGDDSLQLVEYRRDGLLNAQCLSEDLRDGEQRLGMLPRLLELGDVVVDGEEAGMLAVDHQGGEHQLDVHCGAVLPRASGDSLCTTGGQ